MSVAIDASRIAASTFAPSPGFFAFAFAPFVVFADAFVAFVFADAALVLVVVVFEDAFAVALAGLRAALIFVLGPLLRFVAVAGATVGLVTSLDVASGFF